MSTTQTPLPATTELAHPPVPPEVTHESLVATHLLRLQGADPTPVVLYDAQGTTPKIEAAKARVDRLDRWIDRSTRGGLWLTALAIPLGMFGFEEVAIALAGTVVTGLPVMIGVLFAVHRAERQTAALRAARNITVPGPVAVAYRRVRSAAQAIEDGDDHDPEVVATARLTVEGVGEMVARIAEHHTAGTMHTPAGQALVVEVCRLAAEMDAYLVAHNADRFSPGEDDTLALVSATSQFTFAPATPPMPPVDARYAVG